MNKITKSKSTENIFSLLNESGISIKPELLFISFPICTYDGTINSITKSMIPFGLGQLATIAELHNIDVAILDAEALQLSPQNIVNIVNAMEPNAIGLSICSPSVNFVRYFLNQSSELNAIFFAGGPHVSAMRDKCIRQFPEISAFFVGESEVAWNRVLDRYHENSNTFSLNIFQGIKGVITSKHHKVENINIIDNLDNLPILNRNLFLNDPIKTWKGVVSSLLSARGCPARCSYCSPLGPRYLPYRCRSIKNIVIEIKYLKSIGVNYLQFGDDTFTSSQSRLQKFRTELAYKNINIKWLAYSRVCDLHEPAIENMRESGCYKLFLGIESASPRILSLMNKKQDIDMIIKGVELCKQYGIKVQGLFMLGYPSETIDEMKNTIQFALDLDLDDAVFNAVRAYPDTQLYKECLNSGIKEYSLSEFKELIPNINNRNLTYKQIRAKETLELNGIFDIRNGMKYNIVNKVQIATINSHDLGELILDAYISFYYRDSFVERAKKLHDMTLEDSLQFS